MDCLPANDLVVTSGGELYDIILQRCKQMLCFVKTQEGTNFQMRAGLHGIEPIGYPTGCLKTPPLPLSRSCILRQQPHMGADSIRAGSSRPSNFRTGSAGRAFRKQALKHARRQPWAVATLRHEERLLGRSLNYRSTPGEP